MYTLYLHSLRKSNNYSLKKAQHKSVKYRYCKFFDVRCTCLKLSVRRHEL